MGAEMPFHLFGGKKVGEKRPFSVVTYGCERHIARLIQVNVERQGGTVRIAESVESVLQLLREESIDILLLDADHPDTAELRKLVEGDPAMTYIRVLVLATNSMVYPKGPPDAPGPTAAATAPATLGELLHWKG
jgi:hypothetical protein